MKGPARGRHSRGLLFRVGLALGLVAVLVAGTFVAFLRATQNAREAKAKRDRAEVFVDQTQRVLQSVLDAETGQRGFVITRDPRFLEPWQAARDRIDSELEALNAVARTVDESPAASRLTKLTRQYVHDFVARVVALARRDPAAARAIERTGAGMMRVGEIRFEVSRLGTDASRRTQAASRGSNRALDRATTVGAIGLASAVLLFALLGGYLANAVLRPVRMIAGAARRLGGGERQVRAPLAGTGEVAELGLAFNEMAASIDAGARTLEAQKDHLRQSRAQAERVAAELAAQQDLAVDLVATIGFDGCFKRINPAWERTLGYPVAELTGRPFIDYVHPDDVERTEAEAMKLAGTSEETLNFENRYRTTTGLYRWLEWNVRPVADQELLYAVARDVTERKEADLQIRAAQASAERANRAKNEFLSRMSHELRTPLNAILGFGQLLEMDDLQGVQRQSVDQILRGGRHLLELIDEVLDISRIETGTMRMSLEPVDIHSALGDVMGLIAPVAHAAGIALSLDRGDVGECYAAADRQRLRQIILNLLSNAVKYNKPGGGVMVTIVPSDARVRIEVTDTGWGIPVEQLDRLFVAFDRLDAEGGPVQGTGLGLALSKSLAEHMGGDLFVQSTHGEGSVFTLDLERVANPIDEDVLIGARRAGRAASAVGDRTILYIEDNPANATLVAQAFSSQPNVRLLEAMQGSTGVELARAHRPDLILLDLHLPDTDGATVLKNLKADRDTNSIPVIVISAEATQRDIRGLVASGAAAYLTKPLDIAEFLGVVEQHLPERVS